MKCVLCDSPAITEGEDALGLCSWHHAGFAAEAKAAAEAVERGEPGAEETAEHILRNRARLIYNLEIAPLMHGARRLVRVVPDDQPQPQPAPQLGVLGIQEEN